MPVVRIGRSNVHRGTAAIICAMGAEKVVVEKDPDHPLPLPVGNTGIHGCITVFGGNDEWPSFIVRAIIGKVNSVFQFIWINCPIIPEHHSSEQGHTPSHKV